MMGEQWPIPAANLARLGWKQGQVGLGIVPGRGRTLPTRPQTLILGPVLNIHTSGDNFQLSIHDNVAKHHRKLQLFALCYM